MNEYLNPPYEERRQVQRLEDNSWINIRLKEVNEGDIIRFIEPDGEILRNSFGGGKWEVQEKPFRREEDSRWTALCESVKEG